MSTVSVVPVTQALLPQLVTLENACFSDPWSEASLASPLVYPESWCCLAALCDGVVCGYGYASAVCAEAELATLAVSAPYRRRGIARLLVAALLAEVTQRGAECMYLEVRASNTAAKALYTQTGFAEIGVRRRYYRHPTEDAILMKKALPATQSTE